MDKLEKIDQKLEKINDHLGNIDVTLAKQELSLQEHIRRTNLNEQAIEHLKSTLVPINKHIIAQETGFKILGKIAAVTAFIVGVLKITEYL